MCTAPIPNVSEAADRAADATFGPPQFALGQIVATKAFASFLNRHGINAMNYLRMHERGQWGDVPPEDARANDRAVQFGERIISSFSIEGATVWIITEADRSSSALTFPAEY